MPRSRGGKLSVGALLLGLALFLSGVFLGAAGLGVASSFAVGGMIIFFAAGAARLAFD